MKRKLNHDKIEAFLVGTFTVLGLILLGIYALLERGQL